MAGLLWYRSYMDSLANTSGYYPDIHAGHADRTSELTLTVPYLSRSVPSGYNQLELAQIIGGTMVVEGSLQSVEATAHVTKDANDNVIATYPLDNITLRGISTTVDGVLYYDGDTYDPDGTVTRKWGQVDLGTLSYTRYTSGNVSYFLTSLVSTIYTRVPTEMPDLLSDKYVAINQQYASQLQDGTMFCLANGNIYIRDDAYADAASFKTAMSGHGLIYRLKDSAQTTESADPYTAVQTVEDGGTVEFVTSNNIPVGNVSIYRRV